MKIGPKYKICRRLGERVFAQCQTTKFSISGSSTTGRGGKGGRGSSRPRKNLSDYGRQLLEKQKARYTYGLGERQFANYVAQSRSLAKTSPGNNLYERLESRLDNVVFRAGLAASRLMARQIVSHGHILLNGRRMNVPSHQLIVGDRLSIRPASRNKGVFGNLAERLKDHRSPNWLSYDETANQWQIGGRPQAETGELNVNFSTIVEFYSRV
ncbi:MAG: 30S ribosomal protein S4 [Patescibacteria group bacterium]